VTTRSSASSASPWEPIVGFSRAVRVGDVVHVAGTGPVEPDGSCADDARTQAVRCFAIIEAALEDVGASLDDVVRTRMYVTSTSVVEEVGAAHLAAVGHVLPAATMVVVSALADPRWVVEIEAEAIVHRSAAL
jgi:enamine deaminase RidA (YjgF/YER057c/UK114 family)